MIRVNKSGSAQCGDGGVVEQSHNTVPSLKSENASEESMEHTVHSADLSVLPSLHMVLRNTLANGSKSDKLWVSTAFILGAEGSKVLLNEFSATCGVLSTLMLTISLAGIQAPPENAAEYDTVDHVVLYNRIYFSLEVAAATSSLLGIIIPTIAFLYVGMLRSNTRDVAYFLSKFNGTIVLGNLLPLFLSILFITSALVARLHIVIGGTPMVCGAIGLGIVLFVSIQIYWRFNDSMHNLQYLILKEANLATDDHASVVENVDPSERWSKSVFLDCEKEAEGDLTIPKVVDMLNINSNWRKKLERRPKKGGGTHSSINSTTTGTEEAGATTQPNEKERLTKLQVLSKMVTDTKSGF